MLLNGQMRKRALRRGVTLPEAAEPERGLAGVRPALSSPSTSLHLVRQRFTDCQAVNVWGFLP